MPLTKPENFQPELFQKFNSHDAKPIAKKWLVYLQDIPGVNHGEITGELRRGLGTIDQIDIVLSVNDPDRVRETILHQNSYKKVLVDSVSKVFLLLPANIKLIIWLSKPENYASILLLSTGSEDHLLNLANCGISHGYELCRDGIWKSGEIATFKDEKVIYSSFGLPWIMPEQRDGRDEIDQVKNLISTDLIRNEDILSDLHVHSTWSDGQNSIEEMAAAAINRRLSFISINDHSPHVLKKYNDASYIMEQALEINQVNRKLKNGFKVLRGVEVDILPDGSLDLPDEILEGLDVVVASMHIKLDQPMETITKRLIRAIENPYVNIIGHPGGSLYPGGNTIELDWERVFRAAAYNNVALEINLHKSHPKFNLTFNDEKVREAAQSGVLISINSDSHSIGMMSNYRFGIARARRAGLKAEQVINTWTLNHLKLWLGQKKKAIARVQ